jgi:outer membrane immunogenic protein
MALALASAQVRAADVPVKAAPAPKPPADTWSAWVEGGAMYTAGGPIQFATRDSDSLSPQSFLSMKSGWGWEAAAGLDYRFGGTPWHVISQFRYGRAASKSQALFRTGIFGVETEITITGSGSATHRENHALSDFSIGRDVGFGTLGPGLVTVGIRAVDLYAKTNGNFNIPTFDVGDVSTPEQLTFEQKNRFVGAGPRVGVEGSTPLGGSWFVDWLAGVSVLYGVRSLDLTVQPFKFGTGESTVNVGPFGFPVPGSYHETGFIPNVDAQLGLSYWITPDTKITASYRVDAYWGALKTYNASGDFVNVDRFYHGAMLRLTKTGMPSLSILPPPPTVFSRSPADRWSVFVEGGAMFTGGNKVNFAASNGNGVDIAAKTGFEVAGGFDYAFGNSPYHVSAQFRYGKSGSRSKVFSRMGTFLIPTSPGSTPIFVPQVLGATGNVDHNEKHMVADFAVGRDMGFGALGVGQLKKGVRIVDLEARTTGLTNFGVPTVATPGATIDQQTIRFDQKSRFMGVGPRLSAEASIPLGGPWVIDWLAGVSVLYGQRALDVTVNPPTIAGSTPGAFGFPPTGGSTDAVWVPNVDAEIGLSYLISPDLKLTASYRIDSYWGVLKTYASNGALVDANRYYQGAMLKLTANSSLFSGADPSVYAPSSPRGVLYKAPPPPVRQVNWSGPYIGAHIGGAWGTRKWEDQGDDVSDNLTYDVGGALGGLQAGYNFQPTPWLVLGIEGDYSWASLEGSGMPALETEATEMKTSMKWLATLRGRIGYAFDPWLFYVTGGGAWSKESQTITEFAEGAVNALSYSSKRSGYTVGTGFEYALNQHWSAKLEYNYIHFGSQTFAVDPVMDSEAAGAKVTPEIHAVKFGVNYRFGL